VRTTLVLDDEVARAARRRAVEEGLTLGELVTRALRELLREVPPVAAEGVRIPRYGDPSRPVRHTPEQIAELLDEQEFDR
jgi:hypothetical protein